MNGKIDFYCWAKCSTCRKTKEYLSQKDITINERDFFREPFTREEIAALLRGRPAAEMFSFRSPSFRKLGLDPSALDDERLINLMLEEPRLVRRPVVRIGNDVRFGADARVLEAFFGSDGQS
jgi:Spx/MgsR family transcriptional regulator